MAFLELHEEGSSRQMPTLSSRGGRTYGRFENPPPLEHETDAYRMRLEGGVLTVE